jgi:hypothetical protein
MFYESEVYQEIKKAFKKVYNPHSGNTRVGYVNGLVVTMNNDTACHVSVYYTAQGCDYIVSSSKQIGGIVYSDKDLTAFWECLLATRYGRVVVTNDPERIAKDCFFVVSTDYNVNELMHLFILSRLPKEYPQVFEKVVAMYRAGVAPELAIVLAHFITETNGNIYFNRSAGGHHESIPTVMSVCAKYLKNFADLGYVVGTSKCKDNSRYGGVQACYSGRGPSENLLQIVKRFLGGGNVGGETYKNPFPHYFKKPDGVSWERGIFLKRMGEVSQEIMEYCHNEKD